MLNSIARTSGHAILVLLAAIVLTALIMWGLDLPVREAY
jgi:hypothetical protein